jgi:hypothetical protein
MRPPADAFRADPRADPTQSNKSFVAPAIHHNDRAAIVVKHYA